MYLHISWEAVYLKSDSTQIHFMMLTIEVQKCILHVLLNL